MGESEPRSYWQQQHEDARPPRAMLWCGAHRRLVRAFGVVVLVVAVVFLVLAVIEGASPVGPVFGVLAWALQVVLWGFLYPRQADQWLARQPPPPVAQADARPPATR